MRLFEPGRIGAAVLKNRIVRSATYEGSCTADGFPTKDYARLYRELARNGVGGIVTGFAYISRDGRAMQPGQAGIDEPSKVPFYREVTETVHSFDSRIFMQIAHAGRQTSSEATGAELVAPSRGASAYFRGRPRPLKTEEVLGLARRFADAAMLAKRSGFDGVQLHAAHGYLLHQFLASSLNRRNDEFGVDPKTRLGTRFLELVVDSTRQRCGVDFSILVKISGDGDGRDRLSPDQFAELIRFLDRKRVDAIEISYGTMDMALNIFRGTSIPFDAILHHNPRYRRGHRPARRLQKALIRAWLSRKVKPFRPAYNLPYAETAKRLTSVPVISVGGFRDSPTMESALIDRKADFIGLSRPLICEPDLVERIAANNRYVSRCASCNNCAVMCDSPLATRCYLQTAEEVPG